MEKIHSISYCIIFLFIFAIVSSILIAPSRDFLVAFLFPQYAIAQKEERIKRLAEEVTRNDFQRRKIIKSLNARMSGSVPVWIKREMPDTGLFNALCFEVSLKCHRGGENHSDGTIWDSNRGVCVNLCAATEEEDGCHGKSLCPLS